uniref:F-box/kelch-repeat protein At3g23880-like n=1 Tax=Fragaria vesca subsp. vesca TaxID=101020 RepID=UPI0005C8F9FC|nr:PREDICTED: F-box/kelch-repeat protein At3g23880-like [Fragaria vesca subsp. vesca]
MMEAIPEDIIQEIFLKLPIKSLLRCTTVCKSWLSLIKSSSFIDTHLRNQNYLPYSPSLFAPCDMFYYCGQHDILLWNNKALRCLDWYNITRAFNKLELLHPKEAEYSYDVYDYKKKKVHWFDVVGTCNGILCLTGFRFDKYQRRRADVREAITAIIWNPSIKRFVIIPSGFFVDYAFGYDSSTNDYKILRSVVHDSYEIATEVEVWSLARGSWKTLIPDIIPANLI